MCGWTLSTKVVQGASLQESPKCMIFYVVTFRAHCLYMEFHLLTWTIIWSTWILIYENKMQGIWIVYKMGEPIIVFNWGNTINISFGWQRWMKVLLSSTYYNRRSCCVNMDKSGHHMRYLWVVKVHWLKSGRFVCIKMFSGIKHIAMDCYPIYEFHEVLWVSPSQRKASLLYLKMMFDKHMRFNCKS